MATTWIKAIHRSSSGSISAALKSTLEYAGNPEKTQGGEFIATYACSPMTAESEFLLSKKLYHQQTGRNQGQRDVIGYQIRQSFKPGEVTTEQALQIGYQLAMRWTRGQHQFVVAAHTNTNNPHTHIFFNSVTLNHDRKFQDFKHSAIALRRVSDKLCLEHGLSIVENPGLSKGHNRAAYLGENKPLSGREKLRKMIDSALEKGYDFEGFISAMTEAGCEVKRGKNLSFKIPGAGRFARCKSLGADYTEEAILERLSSERTVKKRNSSGDGIALKNITDSSQNRPSLLIDIQAKLLQGKGEGYEHWATIFNLQQAAKTLLFLQDNGIDSYEDLAQKSASASAEFTALSDRIKAASNRLSEIAELQKQIATYSKTRQIYAQYKASGWDKTFYEQFRADITLHKAAKKHFDSLGLKKLPTIQSLKQEWATLDAERRKLYSGYKAIKQKNIALGTAKANADVILKIDKNAQGEKEKHTQKRSNPHHR